MKDREAEAGDSNPLSSPGDTQSGRSSRDRSEAPKGNPAGRIAGGVHLPIGSEAARAISGVSSLKLSYRALWHLKLEAFVEFSIVGGSMRLGRKVAAWLAEPWPRTVARPSSVAGWGHAVSTLLVGLIAAPSHGSSSIAGSRVDTGPSARVSAATT